jgi:hypothetical protein
MNGLSSPAVAQGSRFVIQVPPETQEEVKEEMVGILLAMQTIINKTLEGNGQAIQAVVEPFTATGTQGHPEIVMFLSKYPDKFSAWRQLGRNGMHATFSRIERLAESQPLDKEAIFKETGTLLGYCYGCHATFTLP